MVNAQELAYVVADAVATHNLIHYAKKDNNDERLRLVTGATMASLGFTFGPELEDRLKHMNDQELTEQNKKQFLHTAGGIALGGVLGYVMGPDMYKIKQKRDAKNEQLQRVQKETNVNDPSFDRMKPGGLLTIASAGWLGYSLFLHEQTEEAQDRQLWGLGAGVVGYLYGPRMMEKFKGIAISPDSVQTAAESYSRGSALFGAVAGGALGWYSGKREQ